MPNHTKLPPASTRANLDIGRKHSFCQRAKYRWKDLFVFIDIIFISVFCGNCGMSQRTAPQAMDRARPEYEQYSASKNINDLLQQKYLFGDWDGTRKRLAKNGVTFDLYYEVDSLANPVGGMREDTAAWGRFRATMNVDFGRLNGWKGLTFLATGVYQYGTDLGAQYIGSIANPSGLAGEHTLRIDSYWLDQSLFRDKVFVRAGQFAGQDYYGTQEYGGSFLSEPLNSDFGNLFSAVYESYDPASKPAVEVRLFPVKHYYLKVAALSGDRHPYRDDRTGFNFKIKDSVVIVDETGRKTDGLHPGIYKLGSVYNTGLFTDPVTGLVKSGNHLIYFMANQAVYRQGRMGSDSKRGLDVHFGFDTAPDDVSQINYELTGEIRYKGPFTHRSDDTLALGIVDNHNSDHFNIAYKAARKPTLDSEQLIELSYRSFPTTHFTFQPDFQYIVNVGGGLPKIKNAVVLGFHTKVTF